MDNVETGDEDVRKNLGAIPSAKAVNPHHQQQQQHSGDFNMTFDGTDVLYVTHLRQCDIFCKFC